MKMAPEIEELRKLFMVYKEQGLKDYFTFLRFQSISSEPSFQDDVRDCADWVSSYLKKIGFEVELWPTSGHPTIFANYEKAGPNQPTVLIYNHYDVQPVDPLDQWESPPFEPTVRNGEVFARGAQDNKGQCFYVLLALKALIERNGGLPVNVKLCIEGEEECASTGLSGILNKKKKELSADYLAIVDMGMPNASTPAITLGVRGMVTMDVEVTGTDKDLHSGSHGGVAYNPIHALIQILDKVRDASGKITIPGFYNDVIEMTDKEKSLIDGQFNSREYEKNFGAKPTGGEVAYPPLARNWFRPTIEINGISGGYSGTGFKTVIPSKAHAKVSCRLVPNQDPLVIAELVSAYFQSQAPEGTNVKVTVHAGTGKSLRASSDSLIAKAFVTAYEEIFQTKCKCDYSGGSIPVLAELADVTKATTILVGLGLPDDAIHAPNEHFGLDRIEKGFLSIARMLQLLKTGSS